MKKFEEYKIGDSYSMNNKFTWEQVKIFTDLTGDSNPIHLDADFAAGTQFKKPIVNGTFYSIMIGTILGKHLPGAGTILLSNEYKFISPVFIDDTITASVKIANIFPEKKKIELQAQCINQNNQVVLSGSVVVKKIY